MEVIVVDKSQWFHALKDRQLLIERLLRCWALLYSYTSNIDILYIKKMHFSHFIDCISGNK